MTTLRDSILQGASEVQGSLEGVLEGMDYCLDWKPDDTEWSAREVLWHILEVPPGGIANAIHGVIQGTPSQVTIIGDETYLNPEREAMDLDAIRQELRSYFARLEEVLGGATDDQLAQLTAPCRLPQRNHQEDRTAQRLLEGLFLEHWREHIGQLSDLRSSLGLD